MNNAIPPNQMNPMNPMYQQNVPFNSNISQFMMKQMNNNGGNAAGVAAAGVVGAGVGVGMPNMGQNEQMSAFSTNDVRTMNMNMSMQANPMAFQQHLFSQQPPPTANIPPPFNAFAQPPNAMAGNLPPQLAVGGMGGVVQPPTGGNKFGGSHMSHNGNGGGGPGGNHHHNMSHNITCCVRVRNLCNLTNYSAIRKFFAGLLIPNDGIKMINDMDGNRTGQAYIRFARPNFVMQAIQRSNQKLGRNVIQIQELDEKTYDESIDSYRPPRRNNNNNNNSNNYRSDHDRNDNRDREYRGGGGRNSRFKRNSRDYSDDDDDDDDRTSSRGSRGSRGNSDNEHDNDVMCISDSNDSKDAAPFTTVLIEDLPPFTKEQDIMKLFSSYPLVHIVMAKRSKMFSSYVRFHSADDAKAAVKNTACHKISFKTVYISACSEEEFETARKEFSGELDLDIGRPPMKSMVEENRSSMMDKNDRSDIKSPDTTTLQNDDYATEESNEMTSAVQSSMDMSAAPSSSSSAMHGISLESIPGINLADPRINASKFPFLAAAGATSAASSTDMENKHSTQSNERIDPRTRAAVQPPMHNNAFNNFDAMQQQQQHQQPPGQHQSQFQPAGGMMDPSMSEVCCILIENMEYRTTEAEIVDWVQHKSNLVPIRIQLLVNDRNQTNGNGFVQFASNAQACQALEQLDKAQFKSRVVHISLAPWPQIMMTIQQLTQLLRDNGFEGIDTSGNQPRSSRFNNNNNNGNNNRFPNNRFNNNNGGGGGGGSGGGGNSGRMNNRPNNRNGNNNQMNGNVVSMTNVPYKASIEDIMDFFSDFDMTPEDIIRRYNDEGKPTGDLRVRFESPAEARRAIDLKDKCRLANRPVYLQLFNY